jgi:hypothetical protein
VSEDPFGRKMTVILADQDFDATPGMAVPLRNRDGGAHSLPLAGIGTGMAVSALDDFPFVLAPHNDISQIHDCPRSLAFSQMDNVSAAIAVPAVFA